MARKKTRINYPKTRKVIGYTPEKLTDIIPMIKKGMFYEDIAELYNVKRQTVANWVQVLRKEGFEVKARVGIKKRRKIN